MASGEITPCDQCGEKPIFFAYPLLVCNPFGFDYTLVKQEEFPDTIFGGRCFTLYARGEKRNHYVYTYMTITLILLGKELLLLLTEQKEIRLKIRMDEFFLREFLHLHVEKQDLIKIGGIFREKFMRRNKIVVFVFNAFREDKCFEFYVYKCSCKICEKEEVICRSCAFKEAHYVHLCKCKKNERHITSTLRDECFDV